MASRTSSEMSWIDLNIPDTPEGKLQLVPSLYFDLLGRLGLVAWHFLAGLLTPVLSPQRLRVTWTSFLKITD